LNFNLYESSQQLRLGTVFRYWRNGQH